MSNRLGQIADAIFANTRAALGNSDDAASLKDQAAANKAERGNVRERMLVTLADLSFSEAWTGKEIGMACAAVAERANDKLQAKSLGVILGEVRRAVDPLARGHMAGFIQVRDTLWEQETSDKDGSQVCHEAFKRGYHMVLRLAKAAVDGEGVFTTPESVRGFAQGLVDAQNADPARAAKTVEDVRSKLAEIARVFGSDGVGALARGLEAFDETYFAETVKARATSRAPRPVVVEAPVAQPVEGTGFGVDILDEMLKAA